MFFHLHLSFTSLLSKFETSMHCKNVHQEDIHDRYTKKFVDFMSQIDAFKTKNRGRVVSRRHFSNPKSPPHLHKTQF